jgi:hypothetical protein
MRRDRPSPRRPAAALEPQLSRHRPVELSYRAEADLAAQDLPTHLQGGEQHGLAEHVRDRPQRLPTLRLLRDVLADVLKASLSTDTEGWEQDAGIAVLAADELVDPIADACRLSETFREASVDLADRGRGNPRGLRGAGRRKRRIPRG